MDYQTDSGLKKLLDIKYIIPSMHMVCIECHAMHVVYLGPCKYEKGGGKQTMHEPRHSFFPTDSPVCCPPACKTSAFPNFRAGELLEKERESMEGEERKQEGGGGRGERCWFGIKDPAVATASS